MKAGHCCKLPLKTAEEDQEEEEVTASLAVANAISMDATLASVLSV